MWNVYWNFFGKTFSNLLSLHTSLWLSHTRNPTTLTFSLFNLRELSPCMQRNCRCLCRPWSSFMGMLWSRVRSTWWSFLQSATTVNVHSPLILWSAAHHDTNFDADRDRDNADVNLDFVLGFLCSLIWVCDGSGSFFLISSRSRFLGGWWCGLGRVCA